MKMFRVMALSILLPAAALAQQVPPDDQEPRTPPFAPLTLEKKQYDAIKDYIDNHLPTGLGRPLMNTLESLEIQAAMEAQAAAANLKDKAGADAKKLPQTGPSKP